jgi:hypothetical protein
VAILTLSTRGFSLANRNEQDIFHVQAVNILFGAAELRTPGHMIIRPYQYRISLPNQPSMLFIREMDGFTGIFKLLAAGSKRRV